MALCESGGNVRLAGDVEAHAEKRSKMSKQATKPSGALPVHDDDSQQKSARAQSDKRKSLASAIDMSQRDKAARSAVEGMQTTAESSQRGDSAAGLTNEQIGVLYSNCIKLAAENKITTRNTWNLKLIDHMIEIVNMTDEDSDQTNFQKASCTLEAGVRIYSCRVDAVHAETFKVLGGLHRSAGGKGEPDGADGEEGGDHDDDDGDEDGHKETSRKHAASSSVTLEPSFESLRLKKLDTSFAVDPLFHKTSAQFDEGGAKGLLLSTLSCYRGCHLIFDSDDVPDASVDETSAAPGKGGSATDAVLDLTQLARPLENACSLMGLCHGITPALDGIRTMLGYDDQDKDAEVASLFYEYDDDDIEAASERHAQAGAWGLADQGGAATLRGEAGGSGADAGVATFRADQGEQPEGSYAGHGYDDGDGYDGADFGGGDPDDDDDGGGDAGGDASSSVYVDAVSEAGTAFFSGDSGVTHAGGDEVVSRPYLGPAAAGSPGPAISSGTSLGGSLGFASYTSEQVSGWVAAAGGEPAMGLSLLLGSVGQKAAAWAGPDHWRFRPRAAAPAGGAADGEDDATSGGTKAAKKGSKKAAFFIDFENLPAVPLGTFAKATKRGEIDASTAALPLARNAGAVTGGGTLLPDDLQYAPRELMKLFLKPSWQGLLSGGQLASEDGQDLGARDPGDDHHGGYDNDDYAGDGGNNDDDDDEGDAWGGGGVGDDLGDLLANLGADAAMAGALVDAPSKVAQIKVNYARSAKQVDVRALKQVLWDSLRRAASAQAQAATVAEQAQGLSFNQLLRGFQQPCPAGLLEDISVHLCFICVLHLANEHGLAIVDRPDLAELYVRNVGAAMAAAPSPAH